MSTKIDFIAHPPRYFTTLLAKGAVYECLGWFRHDGVTWVIGKLVHHGSIGDAFPGMSVDLAASVRWHASKEVG